MKHVMQNQDACWCQIQDFKAGMEIVHQYGLDKVDEIMIDGTTYKLYAKLPDNGCTETVGDTIIVREGNDENLFNKDKFVRKLDIHCINGHILWDLPRARRITEDNLRKLSRAKIADMLYRFNYELNQ